jgi:hypothetical protein
MATYQTLKQRLLSAVSEDVDSDGAQVENNVSYQRQIDPITRRGRAWRTGIIRRFPWSAGSASLLAILCTAACVGVLVAADESPVSQWRVAPSVVLAILIAVVNASLSFALAEAVNYRWWIQAVDGSSTLADLERVWMYGTSFASALISGRHVNLVALASVAVTILAIDGPLLQRAISAIEKDVHVSQSPVNVTLADQIPLGYSGLEISSGGHFLSSPLISEQFQEVVRQYQQREPIVAHSIVGCYGTCRGDVQGAGLQVVCEETVTNKPWFVPGTGNETIVFSEQGSVLSPGETFGISFGWSGDRNTSKPREMHDFRPLLPLVDGRPPDEAFMHMNLTWSPNGTIPDVDERISAGQGYDKYSNFIHQKNCKLYSGSARYPVLIRSDVVAVTQTGQLPASHTIELQGQSEFVPGSFQDTPRLIIDAIHTANDDDEVDLRNVSDLALSNPSDRFSRSKSIDDTNDGPYLDVNSYLYGTLSGLATFLQNSFGSQNYVRKGHTGS